jgi:hypothetical protein
MKRFLILGMLLTAVTVTPVRSAEEASTPAQPPAKSVALPAIPETLMFTVDEYNDIQSHLSVQADNRRDSNKIEQASLYLSSILYTSPTDWTVWINGVPIGPKDDLQDFHIISTSSNAVELLVPLSALGMHPIKLGPNQTFVARSGVVVEGQVR